MIVAGSVKNGFLGGYFSNRYKHIRSKYKDFYKLYENLNHFCHEVLKKLELHRNNKQEIIVCILFIKVLTIFQGIYLLTRKGMVNEAQILLRSMLEAMFIISAISKDNDFIERYVLSEESERNRLYKKIDGNPEWKAIVTENIDELIAEQERLIKERNIKTLTIKEIAKRSGLYELHYPVYSILSKNVHATPDNITEYFTLDKDGDIEKLLYGPTDKDIIRVLHASMYYMVSILEIMNELFELNISKTLDNFKKLQTKLR